MYVFLYSLTKWILSVLQEYFQPLKDLKIQQKKIFKLTKIITDHDVNIYDDDMYIKTNGITNNCHWK